jgi:hypothetical protein
LIGTINGISINSKKLDNSLENLKDNIKHQFKSLSNIQYLVSNNDNTKVINSINDFIIQFTSLSDSTNGLKESIFSI